MAVKRNGLGKGLDSLIPDKTRKMEHQEVRRKKKKRFRIN